MLIKTMEDTFSADQVLDILRDRDKDLNIIKIDRLYYPFAKIIYNIKLKGLLEKYDRQMMCNVDMVEGRPAIGQGKPKFMELEIDEVTSIPPQVELEKLTQIGHDYVLKIFVGKMKILHTPNISVDEIEYFHKLFYLVQCRDENEVDYFILADSMDGNITILDY